MSFKDLVHLPRKLLSVTYWLHNVFNQDNVKINYNCIEKQVVNKKTTATTANIFEF